MAKNLRNQSVSFPPAWRGIKCGEIASTGR
jgi:hypothetical protein